MRIPIVDKWVDKTLESKPKKVNYVLETAIKINKGQKAGKVDIPCTLLSSAFSLQFPSGVKYIYGDEGIKEESKEVEYKSCPSIGIVLPDVADADIELPLKMGFDSNPLGLGGYFAHILMATLICIVFVSLWVQSAQELSLLSGAFAVGFSIVAAYFFRLVQKGRQMVKQFTIRKVG